MSKPNHMPTDKQKKSAEGKGHKLAFSPLYLNQKSFTEGLENNPAELTQSEVHAKCFEVLGLLDELARAPRSPEEAQQSVKNLEMADKTTDLDSYLKTLDTEPAAIPLEAEVSFEIPDLELSGRESAAPIAPATKPEISFPKNSRRAAFRQRIRQLLSFPAVRTMLQTEMKKEMARLKPALPHLRRLQKVQKAQTAATLDMHKTYMQSKRVNKGKLVESAGQKIEALSEIVAQAEAAEFEIITDANSVESGFITAQELLEYKSQLRNHAFALTKSRQDLLKKLVEHAMSGQKIFLVGATGTGKTELAFYAANELTGDYEVIPWHEGTVMKDVIGQMQISKNPEGDIVSTFKPGPLPRALSRGVAAIHEEFTGGSNRTMLGMKYLLNLRPGDTYKLPETNGTAYCVDEKALQIFTANLKDERTADREDLDPAILRMLKGIQVQYMPADELLKVTLATLIEETGVLQLSKSEVELLKKLAEAAAMMEQCHEGQISGSAADGLKQACGVDDLRINKNFLDTGTFLKLFAKYDYEKRQGESLSTYLAEQLAEFINDPKATNAPEERKLALGILKLKGVITNSSSEKNITVDHTAKPNEKDYLLPSELGFINVKAVPQDESDPFAGESGETDGTGQKINEAQSGILNMLNPAAAPAPTPRPRRKKGARSPEALTEDPRLQDDFNDYIDRIADLTPAEKLKIKLIPATYARALKGAQALSPDEQFPSKSSCLNELKSLSTAEYHDICNLTEEPSFAFEPARSFDENIGQMNRPENLIYKNANEATQVPAYVNSDANSPYKTATKRPTGAVYIVEGKVHPKAPPAGTSNELGKRKEFYQTSWDADPKSNRPFSHIRPGAMQTLLQGSLIEATEQGDNNLIIDNWESGTGTFTFLNQSDLTESPLVAYANFYSASRRAFFRAYGPEGAGDRARGRASVQLFTF